MEIEKLQARKRSGRGKSYTRKARAAGWIPAAYYGNKLEPVGIEVPHKEFAAVVRARRHNHLFDLGFGADSVAVIREIQRNPLKDADFYHLDFMHVDMNEKITVDVPLEFVGVPVGVKDDGGVLGHPHKTVKVECLPAIIPDKIKIDVSALKIGGAVHVRDVSIPNVTIKYSPDEVLAVVNQPTREKAKTEDAAAEPEAATPAKAAPAKAAPAKAAKK